MTGYFLLGAGAAAIIFVPSSRVWGKRHAFIIGLVLVVASSFWAANVGSNYNSMIGARVVQGIGCAPYESMLNAAIGDLYFVHQRGWRMAFANLAIFGSAFFTPIITGKITRVMGWYWTMYFVGIFAAVSLPALFLMCPETAYRRAARFNTDLASGSTSSSEEPKNEPENVTAVSGPLEYPGAKIAGITILPSFSPQPVGNANTTLKTFRQSLSLFDGTKTDDSFLTLLFRPLCLIGNPTFIWACFIQGTMIGWTIFIGVIIAAIFIGPPNFWNEAQAGYAYTGAFIGAVFGFGISGIMSDLSAKALTRANKGVYEPEFRLYLVIPMFITGAIGLYGFSITGSQVLSGKYSAFIPLMFFGFEVCSMVIGTVASALYVVDAYRDISIEAFTLMIIFKNFFSYILTYYAVDWVVQGGERTMIIVSSVQMGVCALTIPMYFWGKRCRSFYARHDVFAPLTAISNALGGKSETNVVTSVA